MAWTLDPPSVSDASWTYADQQAVEDLIHADNTEIAFDLDDDGNIDSGSVQRAGDWSDGYINLALRLGGQTAPNALTDADITATLRGASAHLAVWYGWHERGLRDDSQGQPGTGIAGIMSGYKKFADDEIAKVIGVLSSEAEGDGPGNEDDWRSGGSSEALTPCLNSNDVNAMVTIGCWGGLIGPC